MVKVFEQELFQARVSIDGKLQFMPALESYRNESRLAGGGDALVNQNARTISPGLLRNGNGTGTDTIL